jgi:hypothetical protein
MRHGQWRAVPKIFKDSTTFVHGRRYAWIAGCMSSHDHRRRWRDECVAIRTMARKNGQKQELKRNARRGWMVGDRRFRQSFSDGTSKKNRVFRSIKPNWSVRRRYCALDPRSVVCPSHDRPSVLIRAVCIDQKAVRLFSGTCPGPVGFNALVRRTDASVVRHGHGSGRISYLSAGNIAVAAVKAGRFRWKFQR